MIDLLVVGAGVAGLTVARQCQSSDIDLMVLEASASVGGRIQSAWHNGVYVGDLGPSWVWPSSQPVVRRWLTQLGINTFSQYESGSGLIDYSARIDRYPLPGQYGIKRVADGPQSIVTQLLEGIDQDQVNCNTTVNRIVQKSDYLEVHCCCSPGENGLVSGPASVVPAAIKRSAANTSASAALSTTEHSSADTAAVIQARQVVLAVPLRVAAEAIQFEPGLPAHIMKLMFDTPTWMATQAKVVVQYAKPFWRKSGLSGRVASRTGPLAEIHDHSGANGDPAALFGFMGITAHERARCRDKLPAMVLDQLVRCFGQQAGAPLNLWIRDWSLDRNICSAVDLGRGAEHPEPAPDKLRQPLMGGCLHLAVAETSTQSPGLIDGALSAGERAANSVLLRA